MSKFTLVLVVLFVLDAAWARAPLRDDQTQTVKIGPISTALLPAGTQSYPVVGQMIDGGSQVNEALKNGGTSLTGPLNTVPGMDQFGNRISTSATQVSNTFNGMTDGNKQVADGFNGGPCASTFTNGINNGASQINSGLKGIPGPDFNNIINNDDPEATQK